MESRKGSDQPVFPDSGLGSFGSESDSSPILQKNAIGIGQSECGDLTFDGAKPKQSTTLEMSPNKVFSVLYLGESVLDRRYTQQMLPWIMAEVRRRPDKREIVVEILPHTLRAWACGRVQGADLPPGPSVPVFEHRLHSLSRFARTHQDPKCFAYLTRANLESPFSCHVFQAPDESVVS